MLLKPWLLVVPEGFEWRRLYLADYGNHVVRRVDLGIRHRRRARRPCVDLNNVRRVAGGACARWLQEPAHVSMPVCL